MFSEKSIGINDRLKIASSYDSSAIYNVINNNCETFAIHCVTGIKKPKCFQFSEFINSFESCKNLFVKYIYKKIEIYLIFIVFIIN